MSCPHETYLKERGGLFTRAKKKMQLAERGGSDLEMVVKEGVLWN
jgi:hypothetical protein